MWSNRQFLSVLTLPASLCCALSLSMWSNSQFLSVLTLPALLRCALAS